MGTFAQPAINLNQGTTILVQLTSTANSNKKNEVTAIVGMDVIDKITKQPVIKRDTPVILNVDKHKAKGLSMGGSITIHAISTTAVDGTPIMLTGSYSVAEDDEPTALLVGLLTGLTVLPGVGFFFFCLKGEKAEIPAGTILPNIIIADNYNITCQN